MKKNMGAIDRITRIILGLIVFVLYFTDRLSGGLAAVLLIFAVIFLVTSAVGFCPLYIPLKLSTRKK